MFWASCDCGPAAGPKGVEARRPCTATDTSFDAAPGEEPAGGQVEDGLPLLQLAEHAADERAERIRTQARHRPDTSTLCRAVSSHRVSRPCRTSVTSTHPDSGGRTVP